MPGVFESHEVQYKEEKKMKEIRRKNKKYEEKKRREAEGGHCSISFLAPRPKHIAREVLIVD